MTPQEVHGFLAYMNQHDPRIEPNPTNVKLWHDQIGHLTPQQASAAFSTFVGRSDEKATPRQIKLIARSQQEVTQARERARALPVADHKITLAEWKRNHPGGFLQAYEEGREQFCWENNLPYAPLANPPACLLDPREETTP